MEFFIGTIQLFPYNFIPQGWLPCDGRTLQVREYQALFASIGVTYGGNGTTEFKLPDLRTAKPNDHIQYYIAYDGIYPVRP